MKRQAIYSTSTERTVCPLCHRAVYGGIALYSNSLSLGAKRAVICTDCATTITGAVIGAALQD